MDIHHDDIVSLALPYRERLRVQRSRIGHNASVCVVLALHVAMEIARHKNW
mgnify:CR=1 FL=1